MKRCLPHAEFSKFAHDDDAAARVVRHQPTINHSYHMGGYAKVNEELLHFMEQIEQDHGLLLDPVYTGKALYGIFDMIKKDQFKKGTRLLFIHTGGLQGRKGFGI